MKRWTFDFGPAAIVEIASYFDVASVGPGWAKYVLDHVDEGILHENVATWVGEAIETHICKRTEGAFISPKGWIGHAYVSDN